MTDPRQERGVALVTVLLAMVLMLILVSAMLAVTRNEVVIAGLHRDSVRALEFAQGGVEEAVRRLEEGHAVFPGFTASATDAALGCGPTLARHCADVSLELVGSPGASSAFQEIRAESTVGRSTRRLSYLVFTSSDNLPPNILYGYSLASQGSADVGSGDIYAWSFIKFKNWPSATSQTYAAWGIMKLPGGGTDWCYTHAECLAENPGPPQNANVGRWWPGTRRAFDEDQTIRSGVANGSALDPRIDDAFNTVVDFTCPAGPTGAKAVATIATVGYVVGDRAQDKTAILPTTLLYGCDADNMPYTYVREIILDDESGTNMAVWFKTIIYNDWFDRYFIFDTNAADDGTPATCCKGAFRKRVNAEEVGGTTNLNDDPQWGAVPPYPDFASIEGSLNGPALQAAGQYQTGGGNITAATTLKLGCKQDDGVGPPEMSCPGGVDDYNIVWLDGGDYHINANLQGHGMLVVDGNLIVNGTLTYWGTVIVNGTMTLGAGTVTIYGGLVAKETVTLTGNITVYAGTNVGNTPTGKVTVARRAWWER